MTGFNTIVVVDWSASATPSPVKPSKDAIWTATVRDGAISCNYHRTRQSAQDALEELFAQELASGRRVLAGFDFPFAYPKGFAQTVIGSHDPLKLWERLSIEIADAPDNANNRFEVARRLNIMFPGVGPFWGCPTGVGDAVLPEKGTARTNHGLPERRAVEELIKTTQPCWKLFTTGSVGSQALLGLPRLHGLRQRFGADLAVVPFEEPSKSIVLAEVFPSLLSDVIEAGREEDEIKDRAQVRILAETLSRLAAADLDRMLHKGDKIEGWILGVGDETCLRAASPLAPPPLRNDCFALPAGVDWIPVDTALAHLQSNMHVRRGVETVPLMEASGRVLAQDVVALRSNPPHANTAVDGFGFAGGRDAGNHTLSLIHDRAKAGAVVAKVPEGHAVRILTGAALPEGVDTVVLQEDVALGAGQIAFRGPVKPGANTRRSGEDVKEGDLLFHAGRRLMPADLALAAATGYGNLPVRQALRVGVLSTGDELADPGSDSQDGHIFDANRPMLLSLLARWGMMGVDLGRVADERYELRATLDAASHAVDVILTSGGASSGDEDHVSALLSETGSMHMWRIAVKPGRPLALGLWQGCPIFGLPGNPVAAMVCALVFARPALGVLAGQGWQIPEAFMLPAGFKKRKKPGRREYLRARLHNGRVEVFASEGSGRISGLSWAEGLVELPDVEHSVSPGDLVSYYPFSAFD